MTVFAHGIVGRADLPIPELLFVVAAAAVLVLSFLALATLWSTPRLASWKERRLASLPVMLEVILGAVGVAALALGVYAGLAGTDSESDNLLPALVFVAFWVGVPVASLVLGDVWRLLSPWRALGRGAAALARRATGRELPEPLPYPARAGRWPAVAGLLAFGVCELCWATAREPAPLAVLVLVYVAAMLVGMSLYGVEAWTRNADAFGAYFGLFAALAPLTRRAGALYLRPPLVGATRLDPVPRASAEESAAGRRPGAVALALVGIGITAFDGAKEGPLFNDAVPELQELFLELGLGRGSALELGFVVGLAVMVGLVAAIWSIGAAGMPRLADGVRPARALAHSLVPILAAYVVAHYFSLLAYNGQDLARLISDPLGDGSDLLGSAGATIDYGVVSATAIWYVQVVALVTGHLAALVLAHDRALELYGSQRGATRSQVVMLAVMVCFTCMGLWLLSEANG